MSAASNPLPREGDLETHPLPRVLLDLWRRSFTGRLRLTHGRVEHVVTWLDGAPVATESNRSEDALGARLLDEGVLDEAQHAQLREHCAARSMPEAVALLALKWMEPKALVQAMRRQIAGRLVDTCAWPTGRWALESDGAPGTDTEAFRVDPLRIAFEGIASHWRPDQVFRDLEARLPQHAVAGERFDALAKRLEPSPEIDAVRGALDPSRTFQETVCTSLAPERLAAAWVLAETGAVVFHDAPPADDAEEPAEAGDPAEAATDLQIEVEVRGDDAPASDGGPTESEAETAVPSPEAEALKKELVALHERLDEADHYEILGVQRDASDADVKKAYFSAAKRFHPDTAKRLGLSELRREANELFARIAQAYQVLSSPQKRQEYDARATGGGAAGVDGNRVVRAEALYRKGEVLLKVGNFAGALDFLRPCVDLWPEEADYQLALGWALYKKRPSEPEVAREHLEKADALRGDDPLVLFRLGMVLRKLGEADAGQMLLDRAKSLEKQKRR